MCVHVENKYLEFQNDLSLKSNEYNYCLFLKKKKTPDLLILSQYCASWWQIDFKDIQVSLYLGGKYYCQRPVFYKTVVIIQLFNKKNVQNCLSEELCPIPRDFWFFIFVFSLQL